MDACVTLSELKSLLGRGFGPLVIDARRKEAYAESGGVIPGAIRRDPETITAWWRDLDLARPIVVYCVSGHEVSQAAAAFLREHGLPAHYLEGGFAGWMEAGETVVPKPGPPSRWVTRERPKIDRIACPWLIRRFIDSDAQFIYVPATDVRRVAAETGATPYDVPDVEFTHVGEGCSFDTFVARHRLSDPALLTLADIVRRADTDRLDLAPPASGLFAISLGLSANIPSDPEMLRFGMVMYDALYTWLASLRAETHNWPPAAVA
jgi:rhodanese-related sulfurtransferase